MDYDVSIPCHIKHLLKWNDVDVSYRSGVMFVISTSRILLTKRYQILHEFQAQFCALEIERYTEQTKIPAFVQLKFEWEKQTLTDCQRECIYYQVVTNARKKSEAGKGERW